MAQGGITDVNAEKLSGPYRVRVKWFEPGKTRELPGKKQRYGSVPVAVCEVSLDSTRRPPPELQGLTEVRLGLRRYKRGRITIPKGWRGSARLEKGAVVFVYNLSRKAGDTYWRAEEGWPTPKAGTEAPN